MNSTFARSNNQFGNSFGMSTGARNPAANTNGMGQTFGKSFGDGNKYQSTIQMNFRGQDRKYSGMIGKNPNNEPETEIIENLQQQIHFMDLERKILKEKVFEDEKNSGIGSLYDDEKTSHQHIHQLRLKYHKMKRDYEKQMDALNQENLDIRGKQFELEAQIDIMQVQNQALHEKYTDFKETSQKQIYELKKESDSVSGKRQQLESDMAQNLHDLGKASKSHFENKMYLYKEKEFGEIYQDRYGHDVQLTSDVKNDNNKKVAELEKQKTDLHQKWASNSELQKSIKEAKENAAKIEVTTIKIQTLKIQAEGLKNIVEDLDIKKDDFAEDLKTAKQKNDELKATVKSKEEILQKRLQTQLTRDKNPEMKELIAQEELVKLNNEDLDKKLTEEQKKFDDLKLKQINLTEKLRLAEQDFKETEAHNSVTNKEIEDLKKLIEIRQKEVDELDTQQREENNISETEHERNRRLDQDNAALKARVQYIEERIDYTCNVTGLDTQTFTSLKKSNESVNGSVEGFVKKLEEVQTEIQKIVAIKTQI